MTNIREGYAFAPGPRGTELANKVLEATKAAGLDPKLVRTTQGGYLIPVEAIEHYTGTVEQREEPEVVEDDTEASVDSIATGEQAGETGGGEAGGTGDGTERPAGNASTEVWQQYAISQGLSEEDAKALSRAELVEKYPAPAE